MRAGASVHSQVQHPAERVGMDHAGRPDDRYVADRLALLEDGLESSIDRLGAGLGALGPALSLAVGTGGRGGRRWRPLLTLAACEACGMDVTEAVPAAIGVELTHTASLVLDDLPCMDDSAERRGHASAHRRIGAAGAILMGIGLLARAAELLADTRNGAQICAEWGRTFGLEGMAGGQAMDVGASNPLRGAPRRLHRKKSTVLVAFAVSTGARAAGASEETRVGLSRFGRDLGWAYQLADDEADIAEDTALGKPPGGRRPGRQSRVLLRRGLRTLESTPGLDPAGVALISNLARGVVPTALRAPSDGDVPAC